MATVSFHVSVSVHPAMSANRNKLHIRDEIPASESSEPFISESSELPDTKPKRTTSKRKAKTEQAGGKKKIQRTLSQIANRNAARPTDQDVVDHELCTSEPNGDHAARKPRGTGEYESTEVGTEDSQCAVLQVEISSPMRQMKDRSSPQVIIPRSSPLPTTYPAAKDLLNEVESSFKPEPALPSTPPRKLLRLNANGKFSSPPSKKLKEQLEPDPEAPRRRVRPHRAAAANTKRKLLVKLSYGSDKQSRVVLGERISRILSGDESVAIVSMSGSTTPKRASRRHVASEKETPKKASPKKPPHPFFNREKTKAQPPSNQDSLRKTSTVTPGKLRMQAMSERPKEARDAPPFGSALLRDRLLTRHPGAREAPFPGQAQAHVRGEDEHDEHPAFKDDTFDILFSRRKRKQANLPVAPEESTLYQFSLQLEPELERVERSDGFQEPSNRLKVPNRLIISGQEIAQIIACELSVPLADVGMDELQLVSSQPLVHLAIQRMYARLPHTLTAFDESRGETLAWTQKHAPSISADVLQPEHEMAVLKNWLNSLAVQSVEGAGLQSNVLCSKHTEGPRRKRKKKQDEMDDFLVDSDEDVQEMSEIIGSVAASPMGPRKSLKSIVQVAGDGTKLNNAVLLSGPHGCGKTAAAYAVAKELGYKVFEISSSERRSGKDVLDKIGDMTENHLVKHHGSETAKAAEVREPNHIDEAFQKDLQSGRQGKMSAFFTAASKPAAKLKLAEPKKSTKEEAQKVVFEALKKPTKDQQQSLILLEEVDILFKDDKEFWSTILKLIVTSKRPFIMTCNDEDLVPLQAISLHAVLRFKQPPVELATDYMLLIAASEGHLLKRSAVASLYQHQKSDLRASIVELDYWCQMGIGDPRGGLEWIFQRWPPGSDLDAHGRKLRLVSEDTYDRGMGLTPAHDQTTEDALWWAWTEFGVEPATSLGFSVNNEENAQQKDRLEAPIDVKQKRAALKRLERLSAALSAADICSAPGLPDNRPLDASYPQMSDKARNHYIEGMALLQTDELVDYLDVSRRLNIAITASAYTAFGNCPRALQPDQILATTTETKSSSKEFLTRHAFACFDAISTPVEISLMNPGLLQSAFDSPLNIVALDLAPYVRSIVQFDQALEEQRERLDIATSEGRKAKRVRTTRAARSALEGGPRATTRRERWFTKDLDTHAVLSTAGKDWPRCPSSPPSLGEGSFTDGAEAYTSSANAA